MRGNQAVAMIAAPRMAATAAGHDQEGPADQVVIGAVVHVLAAPEHVPAAKVHAREDREPVQVGRGHDPEDQVAVQADLVPGPDRGRGVMIAAIRVHRIVVHSRSALLPHPRQRRCALSFFPRPMVPGASHARSSRAVAHTPFSALVVCSWSVRSAIG